MDVQALLEQLRAQGIRDEQCLMRFAAVPREKFIDEALEHKYRKYRLPIGRGQTISQPYMVARMTESAELTPQSVVLEIGTGSGYQDGDSGASGITFCPLSGIAAAMAARRRLKQLDLHNVSTVMAMAGKAGSVRQFDAIIRLPPRRRKFLPRSWHSWMKLGGILVLPVGHYASSFETRASPGRRIYYRYRGGRFVCPVSQRAGLVCLLQHPLLRLDEPNEYLRVFPGYSRWVKRIVNTFSVFT